MQSFFFKITKRTIVLFLFVFAVGIHIDAQTQQNLTIKGKVLDSDGNPIPGTSVLIKGTTLGTATDAEGDYTVKNVPKGSILQFSFIGYVTQEIAVDDKTTINAILLEDAKNLEEVTIVAFGTQKKESVVAAITTISPKNLKSPSSNLTTSFAGQMAGMISYQSSGEPGADNASFFIRGVTSFGYNVEPLMLVDNIEVSATELARIQVDDIESFSIMKDAAATALYGARGANGVILIKTKEGTAGKMQMTVRIENTFSQPTKELELADPITYMKMHNEAIITRDIQKGTFYSDDKIERTQPGQSSLIYPCTDWRKELLKKVAINQRVNINLKGGGNIARYYVSASLSQDNGILKADDNKDNKFNFNNNINLKVYTLRSNVNIDLTKTTEMKVMLSGIFEDYNGPAIPYSVVTDLSPGSYMYQLIMRSNPVLFPATYPVDEDHRGVNHTMFGNAGDGQYLNPYAEMVRGYTENNKSNLSAQMEVNQKLDFITNGLNLRALFNTKREAESGMIRYYEPYYYVLSDYDQYTGEYHVRNVNPDNALGQDLSPYITTPNIKNTMYFESALSYNRSFAEKHDVGAQLIYTMRSQTVPATNVSSILTSLPYRNIGLAGRFSYGYGSRYLAELNFGYNASERFSKSHRWGFFPSISGGWVISNESFFEPLKDVVSMLKLRASYGLAGNDKISRERFLYLSNVNLNSSAYAYSFGYEQNGYRKTGISISRYADPDITWEASLKANYAVELSLYKELDIVWEYFTEKRKNILQSRTSIPYSMGLWTTPQANLGKAEGRGTEFSVNYNKSINKDLWIQARVNFTYATNKYTAYEDFDYQTEFWKLSIGHSTTQQYGYIAEGLFIDDADVLNSPKQYGTYAAGDIKYRDLNGDNVITDRDIAAIGYPETPEINYGFGMSMGYKGWDFSFFFNGLARRSFFINYRNVSPFFDTSPTAAQGHNALAQFIADSYWSESNRDPYAVWPRLSENLITSNGYSNTWFLRDGAFLRLKSVELGYSLPERLTQKIKMTGLRVYVTGSNLFTISKFKLWDPEMAGNGLNYPIQRSFNVGVNLSF